MLDASVQKYEWRTQIIERLRRLCGFSVKHMYPQAIHCYCTETGIGKSSGEKMLQQKPLSWPSSWRQQKRETDKQNKTLWLFSVLLPTVNEAFLRGSLVCTKCSYLLECLKLMKVSMSYTVCHVTNFRLSSVLLRRLFFFLDFLDSFDSNSLCLKGLFANPVVCSFSFASIGGRWDRCPQLDTVLGRKWSRRGRCGHQCSP